MNKILTILAVLSLSLSISSNHVYAKSAPPGTGKSDVKANILIMLDRSGSMGWTAPSTAPVNNPHDVVMDSNNAHWATEYNRSYIKKYNAGGKLLKEIRGNGGSGQQQFRFPGKIAIDSGDNIYFIDTGNKRIMSYDSSGNWRCTSQTFPNNSTHIHADIEVTPGNLILVNQQGVAYIYNTGCSLTSTITPDPNYYNSVGPHAIDQNNKSYYFDNNTQVLTRFDNSSSYFMQVDKTEANLTHKSSLGAPYDIEVDGSNRLYILSSTNHKIYVYNATTFAHLCTIGDGYGSRTDLGQLRNARGFGVLGDKVFVGDTDNSRIVKYQMALCTGGASLTGTASFDGLYGKSEKRIAIARRVLKKLVSDTALTTGANFGLQEWGSSARIRIPVSKNGAAQIYTDLDNFPTGGGTYLDRGMDNSKAYWTGSQSPISKKANCQQNYNIVFSDGQWWGTSNIATASWLVANKGVKTFALGYAGYGNTSNYQRLATAGGTKTPLFADDEEQLLQQLTYAIKQVLQSRLTFTAPVIMPDVTSGDSIYQAVFNYKKDHQWEGRLLRYKLKSDGTVGAKQWDAGVKLDARAADTRSIWTASPNVPVNLNNFVAANQSVLRSELYLGGTIGTIAETTNLINFTRGVDTFDEDLDGSTTDERWKLADIYNSNPTLVNNPSSGMDTADKNSDEYYRSQNGYKAFKDRWKGRATTILAGSNGGMLHAFNNVDGSEKWAFIPPSLLPKLRNVNSGKANKTNSIYGVDGSPVVKDIFHNGAWKTVAVFGMGEGEHSYSALDITNIDAPKHMWTFKNDPSTQTVTYWNSVGTKTEEAYSSVTAARDYSKLGQAVSTPRIIRIQSGGNDKWVAIFGAGGNGGAATAYGSAVYIIDIADGGKVVRKIDIADKAGNKVTNSVIASMVPVTPDTTSTANYKGALVYFADFESKLWKLNLTNKGTMYELQQLFDGEATDTNGRRVFHDVTLSLDDNSKLWAFFGTGDRYNIADEDPQIKNRILAIKDTNYPVFKSTAASVTAAKCKNVTSSAASCPDASHQGWYVDLLANEKVTGSSAIMDRVVYFPRYIPNKLNPCNPGSATLSAHAYTCGNTLKKFNLGSGMATSPIIYKGKIYIGISGAPGSGMGSGWTSKDNLIIGNTISGSGGSSNSFSIKSWRQVF